MNKKAAILGEEWPLWFWRILILGIIIVVFSVSISIFLSREVEVSGFESQLILNKIYSCSIYESNRLNFGILDLRKFDNLESCIDNPDVEFWIMFETLDGKKIEKYYQKEKYETEWPLSQSKIRNIGRTFHTGKDYVLINENGKNIGAIVTYNISLKDV